MITASSANEAVKTMVNMKPALSKKINYDALKNLFEINANDCKKDED
jgi:hypothetical protein